MADITSPTQLQETLIRLAGCMREDVAQLEALRTVLIGRRGDAQLWPGGGAVSAQTSPGLAEVRALARRLERVVDWLACSNDPTVDEDGWSHWQKRCHAASTHGVDGDDSTSGEAGGWEGDRWWLPSLALLAATDPANAQSPARELLEAWMKARSRLSHVVVDEIVDGVVGLSASPWPVVDDAGRIRFPTDWLTELAVPVECAQQVVNDSRRQLVELGLLSRDMATRPIEVGDVFAVEVSIPKSKHRRVEADIEAMRASGGPQLTDAPWPAKVLAAVGEWADHAEPKTRVRSNKLQITTEQATITIAGPVVGTTQLPILDVSWDAREQAKMAFWAANQAGGACAAVVERVDRELRESMAEDPDAS